MELHAVNDNDDDDDNYFDDGDESGIDMNPPVPLSLGTPLHQLRTVAEHHLRLKKGLMDKFF